MSDDLTRIGLVDGSVDSNSRTFYVVLDAATVIQLDELVTVTTDLPDGSTVTHYGIVTELLSRFEGADLPSDTGRVIDRTLPAELVRRAEVRVLRVVPELFLAPHAGAVATRAAGRHRAVALFEDEMTRGKLPLGLDLGGAPVYADMRFVDGRSGGHVSISGISGVATKTSYALFLLYQLLETEGGMDLLGGRANRENVRALVFNTKGEDARSHDGGRTWGGHRSLTERNVWQHDAAWVAPQLSRLRDGRLVLIVDEGHRQSGHDWPKLTDWQRRPPRGMANATATSASRAGSCTATTAA